MKRLLLPIVALIGLGFVTPALAQTQGYRETGPATSPKAFQGCGLLAPGLPGPTSGKITKRSDLPPRLRAADRVRLKHAYRMAQFEAAMNPGGVELPAQAKPRVARLGKLHDISPSACPDSTPLRLSRR
jgi:hypothetical protein